MLAFMLAAVAAHSVASPQCRSLQTRYDDMGKSKAWNFAFEKSDNETNQQTAMIIELMKGNHCPMPTEEPKLTPYIPAAEECKIAKMKAMTDNDSMEFVGPCDMSKWKKDPAFDK